MKRRNKKLFLIMASLSLSLSLSGCLIRLEYEAPDAYVTGLPAEEGSIKKAESLTKRFLRALIYQDFSEVTSLIYLPENHFISDADCAYFLKRSMYGDLLGTEEKLKELTLTGTSVEKTARAVFGKETYQIPLRLDADNSWKVDLPGLYAENWSVRVPGECSATIDGRDISVYKRTAGRDSSFVTYTFPAIAQKDHEITVTSDLYGTFSQTAAPKATSDTFTVLCRIPEKETNNILNCIRTIWNGIYKDYEAGGNASTIKKYFSSDIDTNLLTQIFNDYLPTLQGKRSRVSFSDFIMTDISPWETDNYGAAILESANSMTISFAYRLEFADSEGNFHNCNKVKSLVMVYENGTYRIKGVPDKTIFTDSDYSQNDY